MVNELVPLFGAMFIVIVVMVGLIMIFKRWMAQRDKLLENQH